MPNKDERGAAVAIWATVLFVQSYPSYPNTFGQRGFIGCSDKRSCSDNPNETFLAIYILL